jgi:AmiR/NasT family two-component response regulator
MSELKFMIFGESKSEAMMIKDSLVSRGFLYYGLSNIPIAFLKHVRANYLDFVIIMVDESYTKIRRVLDLIEEELLVPCIIITRNKSDMLHEFLLRSRITTCLLKPVSKDTLKNIADISVANYKKIINYENKIKKLNKKMDNRMVIEKAKWLLVEKEDYTEKEAYELIRKRSRDNRVEMVKIAHTIILSWEGK